MQERKNKRLALSFALLLLATAGMFIYNRMDHESVEDASVFRIDEQESIDQVVMESPSGKVNLHYDGIRWRVNERFTADRDLIQVLFATIDQVLPKRPVSKSLADSVRKMIEEKGVQIEFLRNGQTVKSFYAGGNAQKTEAYFQTAEEGPFIMSIPGYRVYASGIFEQAETDWREKLVFDFPWRNFRSLSVSFPSSPADNFTISGSDRTFGVEGMPKADTLKINDYLDAVSLLQAERFYVPGSEKEVDSLLLVKPSFEITVTAIGNQSYHLTIFPPVRGKSTVAGIFGSEPALFAKSEIIPIAKKRTFFQANGTAKP